MKRGGKTIVCLAAGLLLPMLAGAASETAAGPYHAIVARNIFDLRDPPPPQDHSQDAAPPPNVKLIGLMSISGRPQGVFSVMPTGPGKQPTTYILAEDERHESLDVMSIDMAGKRAKVQIGSEMVTLKLEEPKADAGGAPGAIPGTGPGMAGRGGMGIQPGRGGMAGRGGYIPAPGGGAPGTYPQTSSYSPGVAPDANGALPNRQVRTDATDQPTLSPEQQIVQIEANRDQMLNDGNPIAQILPPTPLTASLQAQRDAAQQQAAAGTGNPSQPTTSTPQVPSFGGPVIRGRFQAPPMPGQ
jgi:hypothetical protein